MEITARYDWYWDEAWVIEIDNVGIYIYATKQEAVESAYLIQKVAKCIFHTDMIIKIEE